MRLEEISRNCGRLLRNTVNKRKSGARSRWKGVEIEDIWNKVLAGLDNKFIKG